MFGSRFFNSRHFSSRFWTATGADGAAAVLTGNDFVARVDGGGHIWFVIP